MRPVEDIDWDNIAQQIDEDGYAVIKRVLSDDVCDAVASSYDYASTAFRSRIDMARYNFGQGEYQYFAYPLPEVVHTLRQSYYPPLSKIANDWSCKAEFPGDWPEDLEALLMRCHDAGQTRPTPLLLSYHTGDYNCLHQDLYGDVHFPLQLVLQLNQPEVDFRGGELVLVEQRPRMQSRASVIALGKGDAAIIPVRERPRRGKSRYHKANMRHGVSQIHSGERRVLGIIFHDAR